MQSKSYLICGKCATDLKPTENLLDLSCIPYEWYMDKDIMKKWRLYYCPDCKIIYRKPQRLNYYYNKLKDFITNLIMKPKEE